VGLSLDSLIDALRERGAQMFVQAGELRYAGPRLRIEDPIHAAITAHRTMLIELFTYAPGGRCVFRDCFRLLAEGSKVACPDHQQQIDVPGSRAAKPAEVTNGLDELMRPHAGATRTSVDHASRRNERGAVPTVSRCLIRACREATGLGDLVYCPEHRRRADDGDLWGVKEAPGAYVVNRGVLMTLAQSHGWQALPLGPGVKVGGTERMWRTFTSTGPEEALLRAVNAARQYWPGDPMVNDLMFDEHYTDSISLRAMERQTT